MTTKFENRTKNSTSPYIRRLEYDDVNIYLIEGFTGCCSYLGCDCQRMTNRKIKVRLKSDESLKLTKNGKSSVKIPFTEMINEEKVIKIYLENYTIKGGV